MRGKKVKAIRKAIYGGSPTNAAGRKYYIIRATKQIVADVKRSEYQLGKKRFRSMPYGL